MKLLLLMLPLLLWGAEDPGRDLIFLEKLERRLGEIEKKVRERGYDRRLAEELNSYGYPLHQLKLRYIGRDEDRELYERASRAYLKVLSLKRGMFPHVLKEEMRRLRVPFCDVRVEGKDRERLVLFLKDPADEETVLRIVTRTQLQNAHLIGVESVSFKKCR